jgi:plasmid stabilization system protein ParE
MEKLEIVWSIEAKKNLEDLYEYILEFSVQGAENVVSEILERAKQLEKQPLSGRIEPLLKDLGLEHRYLIQRHFKIIYRIEKKKVRIDKIFSMYQHPSLIKKK